MSLRRIEPVAGLVAPARDRGPVPEQRWLSIEALRVDGAYQRPITAAGSKTIRAIVAAFDWRMFAPVVVCPIEGGLYAIVDGQHRVTAAATCGIDSVPCHVIQADRVTQAKSFGAINGRVTRMSAAALYKARLAAGDALARRVEAAGTAAGVRVLTYHPNWSSMKPGETTAFKVIEAAIESHGDAVVVGALAAAAASAGGATGLLGGLAIGAFVNVLADHREWRERGDLLDICEGFALEERIDDVKIEAARRRMPKQPLLEAALISFFTHREGAPPRRIREAAHV